MAKEEEGGLSIKTLTYTKVEGSKKLVDEAEEKVMLTDQHFKDLIHHFSSERQLNGYQLGKQKYIGFDLGSLLKEGSEIDLARLVADLLSAITYDIGTLESSVETFIYLVNWDLEFAREKMKNQLVVIQQAMILSTSISTLITTLESESVSKAKIDGSQLELAVEQLQQKLEGLMNTFQSKEYREAINPLQETDIFDDLDAFSPEQD